MLLPHLGILVGIASPRGGAFVLLQTRLKYFLDTTTTSECKTTKQACTSARCILQMCKTSLRLDDITGCVANDPSVKADVENFGGSAPCFGGVTNSSTAALQNTHRTYGHGQDLSLNGVEYRSTPSKRLPTISVLVASFSFELNK